MKVLLTGAAGFIGGAIARLGSSDHELIGVDLMLDQAHGAGAVAPAGVHRLDVRNAGEWADLLDGVDVVCHQAALVGAGVDAADLPRFAAHNDLGTTALLAAMAERGVGRLVLASSMVVYGEGRYECAEHGDQHPGPRSLDRLDAGHFDNPCPVCGRELTWALVEETADMSPRSVYAVSKLAQEHYAAAWARLVDGRVIALRYHNVYGPHMPKDTPYSGVAALFRSSIEAGEPPRVFEDGGQMRDFVHVDDVARANLISVEAVADQAPGSLRAFNVCSGAPISILDVAAILGRTAGQQPVVTGQYRLGDVRHVVASPRRAREELGFSAAIDPQEGLTGFATAPLRG